MTTWHSTSRNAPVPPVYVRTPQPPSTPDLLQAMQHEACHPVTPSTPEVEPTKKEYDAFFQQIVPSTPPPSVELCPSPPSKHNRRYTPVRELPTEKQNRVRELWRQKNAQRRAELDELRRKADRTIRIQKVEKSLSQLVQMVRGNELLLKDLMQRIQK